MCVLVSRHGKTCVGNVAWNVQPWYTGGVAYEPR